VWPCPVFYPLSLIAISVTSCCVGLSLRSRDCQNGSRSSKCEMTSSKRAVNDQGQQRRASGDDDDDGDDAAAAAQFCQMNCDSSSTLDRASTRRTRVPPVPPAPVNHVDQSQRRVHHHYQTYVASSDGSNRPDSVDRSLASPANSLLLSRTNSRSNIRPSRYHADVGCSLSSASYLPVGRAAASLRPPGSAKTTADDQRRLEKIERCVDMSLFVLLVLICVGFAVCLVFMSF